MLATSCCPAAKDHRFSEGVLGESVAVLRGSGTLGEFGLFRVGA